MAFLGDYNLVTIVARKPVGGPLIENVCYYSAVLKSKVQPDSKDYYMEPWRFIYVLTPSSVVPIDYGKEIQSISRRIHGDIYDVADKAVRELGLRKLLPPPQFRADVFLRQPAPKFDSLYDKYGDNLVEKVIVSMLN